jgi:hypothetical protein
MRKNVIIMVICLALLAVASARAAGVGAALVDQLRADYAALQQARSEYVTLERAGRLGDAEAADYAAWIRQLEDRVRDDCAALKSSAADPLPADLPCRDLPVHNPAPAAIDIAGETTQAEKTSRMVEQLNGSLGEFDERLLREQDRVRARTPRDRASSSGSGQAGAAGQGSAGDAGKEGSAGGDAEGRGSGELAGGQPGSDSDASGEMNTSGRQGTPGKPLPGAKTPPPDDIPDGSDDDVVARQLREAAEQETDPELKKKLWEEYRRYKAGIR